MIFINKDKNVILLNLSYNDFLILNNVLNEVCNGFYIADFDVKVGCSREKAKKLLLYISEVISEFRRARNTLNRPFEKETSDVIDKQNSLSWKTGLQELAIVKNALDLVCLEYGGAEIRSYIGFSHEEIAKLAAKVLSIVHERM